MSQISYRRKYKLSKKPKPGVDYLSPSQVAKKLDIPVSTVYSWCREQAIEGLYKDDTGHWHIPPNFSRPECPNWHVSKRGFKNKRRKR